MRIKRYLICIYRYSISEVAAFQMLSFACTRYDAGVKKKIVTVCLFFATVIAKQKVIKPNIAIIFSTHF